jgi:hypothetical protein
VGVAEISLPAWYLLLLIKVFSYFFLFQSLFDNGGLEDFKELPFLFSGARV